MLGQRITPVCTGNTSIIYLSRRDHEDHPRMHGEYKDDELTITQDVGSPPYARGIHFSIKDFQSKKRITPVCTGNTLTLPIGSRAKQDHPRMHGEYPGWSART